ARALRRVDVEQYLAGTRDGTNGADVVDGADLVVHMHDADQGRVITQRGGHLLRLDDAVAVRLQIGDLEAFPFQLAAGVQHRIVVDGRDDGVLAATLVEVGHTLDGQVVRLGGTRGPDDFARIAVHQVGNVLACLLDGFLGAPAIDV